MHLTTPNLFLRVVNDEIVLSSETPGQRDIKLSRPGMPILCKMQLEIKKDMTESFSHDRVWPALEAEPSMHKIILTFEYPAHAIHILS